MSLPLNRSVRLRVVPHSVCGTLSQGWPRAKVLVSASQLADEPAAAAGAGAAVSSADGADAWVAAVEAVLAELGQTRSLAGMPLDVELADSLVHIDAVSGDFAGNSDKQLDSVAAACVAELLGDAAPSHEIRWQLQSGGKHLLIAAISNRHVQALTDIAARHRVRLRSVQPDFCLQWNRHAAALKPGSAVFAVASGSDAVVAHVLNGAITAISTGNWVTSRESLAISPVHVKRLMCGLGLEAEATAGALDVRVGRLLASVGQDEGRQSAYVLVAPDMPETALSPRWTVINREPASVV